MAIYPFLPNVLDRSMMITLLSIVGISIILYAFYNQFFSSKGSQYLKQSILILLSISIVHFQYPIDYVIGYLSSEESFIWMNNSIVVKSLYFSTIGLISFFLGYILHIPKVPKYFFKSDLNRIVSTEYLYYLAPIFLVGYFLTVDKLYLAGYYGSVGMGQTAAYFILLFQVVVYGIIIQNSLNAIILRNKPKSFLEYVHYQGYSLLFVILVYFVSVIISGDRGPIIYFSLAYVAGYIYVTKKRVTLKHALITLVIGASFITILGIVRSMDKSLSFKERLVLSISFDQERTKSVMPYTSELAGSIRTLHAVTDYVPEYHPHTYGRFQLQQVIVSIPFSNRLTTMIWGDHYRYRSPASFATWVIQGDTPSSGVGTTCIADFYVEFGLIGVIIGMFLLGYFIRFSEVIFFHHALPKLFPLIFSFVYLSDAIYIARSSALFGFRTVVWIYVLLSLNRFLYRYR